MIGIRDEYGQSYPVGGEDDEVRGPSTEWVVLADGAAPLDADLGCATRFTSAADAAAAAAPGEVVWRISVQRGDDGRR